MPKYTIYMPKNIAFVKENIFNIFKRKKCIILNLNEVINKNLLIKKYFVII